MADEEKEELSEEQKIALLEKKNNSLKLVITILSGLSFILFLGVGTLAFLLSDEPAPELATTEQTDALKSQLDLHTATIDKLEAKLALLEQQRVSAAGVPREMALEDQRDLLRLINIIQNSMRDESRMIKGARSWYEHYNQLLEAMRKNAKERLTKLGSSAPAEIKQNQRSTKSSSSADDFSDSLF